MSILRNLASYATSPRPVAAALRRFNHRCATVFMLHRFQLPGITEGALSPVVLRKFLAHLRKNRFRLEPVDAVVRAYREDPDALSGMVAFTVDDGYAEFASVAAPIFAEFDCPVTVFLPTDFVDGRCWMWWDRVLYAFYESPRRELRHEQLTGGVRRTWADASSARLAAIPLIRSLQRARPNDLQERIALLAAELEVGFPMQPPPHFSAMSWDTVRSLARRGVTFGAHTRTHPTLSTLSDAEVHAEIVESWTRLNEETSAVSQVFAYPIGTRRDAGERESRIVEAAGMIGALSGVPDHVTPDCQSAYSLPRFAIPPSIAEFRLLVGGQERALQLLRRRRRAGAR